MYYIFKFHSRFHCHSINLSFSSCSSSLSSPFLSSSSSSSSSSFSSSSSSSSSFYPSSPSLSSSLFSSSSSLLPLSPASSSSSSSPGFSQKVGVDKQASYPQLHDILAWTFVRSDRHQHLNLHFTTPRGHAGPVPPQEPYRYSINHSYDIICCQEWPLIVMMM